MVIGITSFAIAGAAILVIREAPPATGARARRVDAAGECTTRSATALPDQDLRETVRTRTFYAVLAMITLGTFTYTQSSRTRSRTW